MLGRTSLLPLDFASIAISSLYKDCTQGQNGLPSAHYLAKTLELYEIGNHIAISHPSTGSKVAARLGLPTLYPSKNYYSTVLQHEACLDKWENDLRQDLGYDTFESPTNSVLYKLRFWLHLR